MQPKTVPRTTIPGPKGTRPGQRIPGGAKPGMPKPMNPTKAGGPKMMAPFGNMQQQKTTEEQQSEQPAENTQVQQEVIQNTQEQPQPTDTQSEREEQESTTRSQRRFSFNPNEESEQGDENNKDIPPLNMSQENKPQPDIPQNKPQQQQQKQPVVNRGIPGKQGGGQKQPGNKPGFQPSVKPFTPSQTDEKDKQKAVQQQQQEAKPQEVKQQKQDRYVEEEDNQDQYQEGQHSDRDHDPERHIMELKGGLQAIKDLRSNFEGFDVDIAHPDDEDEEEEGPFSEDGQELGIDGQPTQQADPEERREQSDPQNVHDEDDYVRVDSHEDVRASQEVENNNNQGGGGLIIGGSDDYEGVGINANYDPEGDGNRQEQEGQQQNQDPEEQNHNYAQDQEERNTPFGDNDAAANNEEPVSPKFSQQPDDEATKQENQENERIMSPFDQMDQQYGGQQDEPKEDEEDSGPPPMMGKGPFGNSSPFGQPGKQNKPKPGVKKAAPPKAFVPQTQTQEQEPMIEEKQAEKILEKPQEKVTTQQSFNEPPSFAQQTSNNSMDNIQSPNFPNAVDYGSFGIQDTDLLKQVKSLQAELHQEKLRTANYQTQLQDQARKNAELKNKVDELESELRVSKDPESFQNRLKSKDDEIERLKTELKRTVENSRLISEHSNRILKENTKYREEKEAYISQLESEKEDLNKQISELIAKDQTEYIGKIQSLEHKNEKLEKTMKDYEETIDLVQSDFENKSKRIFELASLNNEIDKLMENFSLEPLSVRSDGNIQPQMIKSALNKYHSVEPERTEDKAPKQNQIEKPNLQLAKESSEPKTSGPDVDSPTIQPKEEPAVLFPEHPIKKDIPQSSDMIEMDDNDDRPPISSGIETQKTDSNDNPSAGQDDDRPPMMTSKPPTGQKQPLPTYHVLKGKKDQKQQQPAKKPAAFIPQNVQIISGKANEGHQNVDESEEDKRETPRRENASNASTPTREQQLRHEQQNQKSETNNQQHDGQNQNISNPPKPKRTNKNPFADQEDTGFDFNSQFSTPQTMIVGGERRNDANDDDADAQNPSYNNEQEAQEENKDNYGNKTPEHHQHEDDGQSAEPNQKSPSHFEETPKTASTQQRLASNNTLGGLGGISDQDAEDFFAGLGSGQPTTNTFVKPKAGPFSQPKVPMQNKPQGGVPKQPVKKTIGGVKPVGSNPFGDDDNETAQEEQQKKIESVRSSHTDTSKSNKMMNIPKKKKKEMQGSMFD